VFTSGRGPAPIRCVVLLSIAIASRAEAGSILIGQLNPTPNDLTWGYGGIAFDGDPNPLVLENGGHLKRVSVTNAAVLESVPLAGAPTFWRSLEYRPSTNNFFTTRRTSTDVLYSRTVTGTPASVGSTGWNFNFLGLAYDPSGALWLASDSNPAVPFPIVPGLFTVNPSTGATALACNISGVGGQVNSLGIDEAGQFFVTTSSSIYQLNPVTGAATFVTSTGLASGSDFFGDIAFNPNTDKWYGVEERRSGSPRQWYLREITGMPAVPEPGSIATLAPVALCAMRRRRRRRPAGLSDAG
jgi:hypothetical protein